MRSKQRNGVHVPDSEEAADELARVESRKTMNSLDEVSAGGIKNVSDAGVAGGSELG